MIWLVMGHRCVRDRSGKPTARYERGLAADRPTHKVTPEILIDLSIIMLKL